MNLLLLVEKVKCTNIKNKKLLLPLINLVQKQPLIQSILL